MINESFIRVLYLDLTNERIRLETREDLREYLGGVGIAAKLFEENFHPDLDPLDDKQPVVFAIGALSTVYPVLTKTVAMFYSPHTKELGESYAGGRLAFAMLESGYDAIVITGKAKKPIYVSIKSNDVSFKDARAIWGLPSTVIGRIIRERESGSGKRSILRIGPAGENGCTYACVNVDSYRHFGRLGLGACLGAKKLKAIVVFGTNSIPIKDFKTYWKVYQDIYKKCTDTELMEKYHDLGTPINVEPLNAVGALPTKNLRQTVFEQGENISGEKFAQQNLIRKVACTSCPVGCIHIGQFRREFDNDGYEYESISVGYDYELIFALGSFIGVKTSREILELIDEVEETGMDAMSTGVVLGWATEAYKRGFVTDEQVKYPLTFGDTANYRKAIRAISKQENEFYADLAKGVKHASEKYGGVEFAMQVGGNEMTGYHTGYGSLLGQACGARHSHLCNGGYSIDQSMKQVDMDVLVDKMFAEEVERCMTNSLVMCLFARKVYDRPTILEAMHAIGIEMTNEQLTEIAERIYATKLRIKKAMGFEQEKVKFPKRFFETPSMHGLLNEETAQLAQIKFAKKNAEFMKKFEGTAQ